MTQPVSVAFNVLAEQMLIGRALEHASNPVALLDRGGRVVWSNKAYSHSIERWAPVDAKGPQVSAGVSLVCAELQVALGDRYRDLWSRLQQGNAWSGSVGLHQQQKDYIYDCILSPLPDAQGRPAYYLLLLHDVTAHHQEKIQHAHAAQHDMLTGLGNRLRLAAAMSGLLARTQPFALFYMDLDGFKGVNDTFGHGVGDDVLKAFARHLQYISRDTDVPIRLGGDEFILLLPGQGTNEGLNTVAERLLSSVLDVFAQVRPELAGRVGVSIGGARYPEEGVTQDVLLAVADKGLYAAKRAGKGCFRMGTPDAA